MADETSSNPEIRNGQLNEKGEMCAIVPDNISAILRKLSPSLFVRIGEGAQDSKIDLSVLSQDEMSALDAFAAEVGGVDECKVRSIDGCYSCTLGGTVHFDLFGNLVKTDCGYQCWYCCREGVEGPGPKP